MPITAGMVGSASGLKNPAGAKELGYRVNLCLNPNIESVSTYWTGNGSLSVERSSEVSYTGSYSLKVTLPTTINSGVIYGNNNRIPVVSGQQYYFSAYIKTPETNETSSYRLRIRTYTAVSGGSLIANLASTSTQVESGSDWVRLSYSPTLSDPGINAVTLLVDRSTAATNSGDYFYIDNVIFEKTSTLKDYFDGSSEGAFWAGTENLSISGTTPY